MQLTNWWLLVAPSFGPQVVISAVHPDGIVATLYSDETAAHEAAAGTSFHPLKLNSLWDARVLAKEGYAGLLMDGEIPVFWLTTDPDAQEPTHLGLRQGAAFLVIDAQGMTTLTRDDVTLWGDLAKFDNRTITTLLRGLPFWGYEVDSPLYEYLPDRDQPELAPTVGALLRPDEDNGAQESVALFTTAFAAEWFWDQVGVTLSEGETHALETHRHDDTFLRLTDLEDLPDDVAIILNPGRHRFFQGFFRRADDQWFLVTINGVWRVESPFTLTQVAKRTG